MLVSNSQRDFALGSGLLPCLAALIAYSRGFDYKWLFAIGRAIWLGWCILQARYNPRVDHSPEPTQRAKCLGLFSPLTEGQFHLDKLAPLNLNMENDDGGIIWNMRSKMGLGSSNNLRGGRV